MCIVPLSVHKAKSWTARHRRAAEIGLIDKRVKVGVPEQGGGGEHLTLNASHLIKKAPRRGKNGACFFEKCVSQYEAFRGVPGGVDLTVKSRKTKGNR